MDLDRLRAVPLFSDITDEQLTKLSTVMKEAHVPQDRFLAFEGEFAYKFFVIEEGTASVFRQGEHVRDLGPGDFFGEIGLLESERRTASVVSRSEMQVVVLQGWDLRALEEEMPSVGRQIREKLLERVNEDRAKKPAQD